MYYIFWIFTIILSLFALSFVALPILLGNNAVTKFNSIPVKIITCVFFAVIICGATYIVYLKLGVGTQLQQYYTTSENEQRRTNLKLQPLYARLQRELLKAQLNHAVDPANEQLIVNFANVHAKLNSGKLPIQVVKLLENVLKSYPQRGNVLNLLAVHYYKAEDYKQAITYWEKILQLIPDKIRYKHEIALINAKIEQSKLLCKNSDQ